MSCRLLSNKVGIVENLVQQANNFEVNGSQRLGTSSIKISVACRGLTSKNELSKPSPICVIYDKPESVIRLSPAHSNESKEWIKLQKTEHIVNNSNPDFLTKVQMEYRFEQLQPLRFVVYDVDNIEEISDDNIIGISECTIANVMHAGVAGYVRNLESVDKNEDDEDESFGKIILVAETLHTSEDEVFLELSGHSVGNWYSWCFVKSFFDVSKTSDVGTYVVAHKSDEVKGMNPYWSPSRISGRNLCCGDWDRSIKIQVFTKSFKDQWQLVGLCITNVNSMIYKKGNRMVLQSSDGKKTKSSISILNCSVSPKI